MPPRPFLTAEWRWLAMLNYRVDPALLEPYVPRGTALDAWEGHTYLSVVGFLFLDTRLLGVPVPFHRDFEEVNLRFYVRRVSVGTGEIRRAVVFVKELVPLPTIASVARLTYNEPYEARSMRHRVEPGADGGDTPRSVEYAWREDDGWGRLVVEPEEPFRELVAGSEAEFITEHYWGYTRQRDGGTIEYQVAHPRWRVCAARSAALEGDLHALYGPDFAAALSGAPSSAFLADGSRVTVYQPRRIDSTEVRVHG